MKIKILEQNGVLNENVDGAALNNLAANYENGIVKGVLNECRMLVYANGVGVDTGLIVVQGFRIKIEEMYQYLFSSTPAEDTNYQLILRVDLSLDRSLEVNFICREKVELVQENLLAIEEGRYELEIATFTYSSLGEVVNFEQKIGFISATGGSSVVVDSELNAESENPVQNKVINEALEGKVNKVDKGTKVLVYTNDDNDSQTTTHYLGNSNNTYSPYNIPMIYGQTAGGSAPAGYLITNIPKKDYHCANKKYVDGKVIHLHKVIIKGTVTQTQQVETTIMLIINTKEEALTVEEILTEEKDNIIDITKDGERQTISQFIYQPENDLIVFEFGNYDYYFPSLDQAEQAVTDTVIF